MKKHDPKETISIIGLGKLGACYAAFYADRGVNVIGVDADRKKVNALAKGVAPVSENRLPELISKNASKIKATVNYDEAIKNSHITFIIVPTPSRPDGSFSMEYVVTAIKKIGKAIKNKKEYHLVVVVSTVLPNDSRDTIIPALEKYSGKKCGGGFGYCYSPSLIALGEVIKNLENPDFLFLGSYDEKSKKILTALYAKVYPDRIPEYMSMESVELAKISLNSYITLKITFANILGELCERIPYTNVDHITTALGKDKRIGSAFFKSGLGYGGPCFPRDNFAFASVGKKIGVPTTVALATHNANKSIPRKIVDYIRRHLKTNKKSTVGILGLAYKTNTHISEESQALEIAELLAGFHKNIAVFDPCGYDLNTTITLPAHVYYAQSLDDIVTRCDVLFIASKDTAYDILPEMLKLHTKKIDVIDPWGMFTPSHFSDHVVYKALGRKHDIS
jgi:UDPglucose 6-dehydrogenase